MHDEDHCPNCKSIIRPSLFEYLPPRVSRKQYKCPHCGTWLTIDGRTRLIMFSMMFVVWMGLTLPIFLYLPQIHRSIPRDNPIVAIVIASIPMMVSLLATLFVIRRVAGWVVSPKSLWDLPSWVHKDQ